MGMLYRRSESCQQWEPLIRQTVCYAIVSVRLWMLFIFNKGFLIAQDQSFPPLTIPVRSLVDMDSKSIFLPNFLLLQMPFLKMLVCSGLLVRSATFLNKDIWDSANQKSIERSKYVEFCCLYYDPVVVYIRKNGSMYIIFVSDMRTLPEVRRWVHPGFPDRYRQGGLHHAVQVPRVVWMDDHQETNPSWSSPGSFRYFLGLYVFLLFFSTYVFFHGTCLLNCDVIQEVGFLPLLECLDFFSINSCSFIYSLTISNLSGATVTNRRPPPTLWRCSKGSDGFVAKCFNKVLVSSTPKSRTFQKFSHPNDPRAISGTDGTVENCQPQWFQVNI